MRQKTAAGKSSGIAPIRSALLFSCVSFSLTLLSCDRAGSSGPAGTAGSPGIPAAAPAETGLDVRPATATECASGGTAVDSWLDVNADGAYEAGIDTGFKTTLACNGSTGPLGPQGIPGTQGTQGTAGTAGTSGGVGPKGDAGPKGDVGSSGPAGSNAAAGGLFTDVTGSVLAADFLPDIAMIPEPLMYRANYPHYTGNADPFVTISSSAMARPLVIIGQRDTGALNSTNYVQYDTVNSVCDLYTPTQEADRIADVLTSASSPLVAFSPSAGDMDCLLLVQHSFGAGAASGMPVNVITVPPANDNGHFYWLQFTAGTAPDLQVTINEPTSYFVLTQDPSIPAVINSVQLVTAPGLSADLSGSTVVAASVVTASAAPGTQAISFSFLGTPVNGVPTCAGMTIGTDQICATFNQNPGSGAQVKLYLPSPSGIDQAAGN